MKIGVIGPTNLQKLSTVMGRAPEEFLEEARAIGRVIAESQGELWVNSDAGMLEGVAHGYKDTGGRRLVVLAPQSDDPWPITHTTEHQGHADEIRKEDNWFRANYDVVTLPDICLCVGLSAGTFSELAYIKWNVQFRIGNLKRLLVMQNLVRGGRLPPELELDIHSILAYVSSKEELRQLLNTHALQV